MPGNYLKNFIDFKLMTDKIIQTGTGNHSLNVMDTFQQIILPAAIQLRKHIIQKKHRFIVNDFLYQINFRKLQGQSCCPLLPLGTIFTDIYSIDGNHQVISVRSQRSQLHPQIPFSVTKKAFLQLFTFYTWFIDHFNMFYSAGKISVYFFDNLIQGFYKLPILVYIFGVSQYRNPLHYDCRKTYCNDLQ